MTIPDDFVSSKYPEELDTDQNLFLVHDALRVVLAEDYDPSENSTVITVDGDTTKFPSTGVLTLTEQCSEAKKRAVSFYYTGKTETTFTGLVALDGFDNTIVRPKRSTYVTQNVIAEHHNAIKDALIAVETFVGTKGTVDRSPFGETMEGRANFLQKLILTPRAWFEATNRVGLVPLEVTFENKSFRLGEGEVVFTWDFGDQSSSTPLSLISSTISVSSNVPISATDVHVVDVDGGTIIKTYTKPNKYTVRLTVENEYGSDIVEFEDFITARAEAPDEAIIDINYSSNQIYTAGEPAGGPYITPPKIRSKVNQFISFSIQDGINPATLKTYAGEEVEGITPIDPIETYTWSLSDDLEHDNTSSTRASYSTGGIYDLILRCDTRYGSYRITKYADCIDIVESRNLWMFNLDDSETATPYEFGLRSETFKTGDTPYSVIRDSGFLNNTNNSEQAIHEFNRNATFAMNGTINSGENGAALLLYAGGGAESSNLADQEVKIVDFEGFSGLIQDNGMTVTRPWNWIYFAFDTKSYFLFGADPDATPNTNDSYHVKDKLNLGASLTLGTPTTLINPDNYINGAHELESHVTSSYDDDGEPDNGRFATYRTAQKDKTGYILRNDGVGTFFKLRDFYRTEGTSSEPIINIRKLPDMTGVVKTEGELVALNNGIFFFNNSGNILAYNTTDSVWESGNAVTPFKRYQDTTEEGFADTSNTLLATSDGDRIAYLSYDYSVRAFIKYNSVDRTFSQLGVRPEGDQWILGVY